MPYNAISVSRMRWYKIETRRWFSANCHYAL